MERLVIKNTTKTIDGGQSKVTMLQSALNSGFKENEVEFITEEEYQTRLENEPKPPQLPTTDERLRIAEETLLFLMDMNLMGGM